MEPLKAEQLTSVKWRVLAIPFKKTDTRLVPHLSQDEVQALLDAPDPATREGIRDRAMLHLAVCAGLRVSELTGLCINRDDPAPGNARYPKGLTVARAQQSGDHGDLRSGRSQ